MFKPLLFISSVIMFGVPALSISGIAQQQPAPAAISGPKNPVKPTAQSQARARQIYKIDCAVCHGDNGDGKTDLATEMQMTLSDWTNPKTLAVQSDADLFKIIRDGKGQMPPEPVGRANDSEVWNLILYIRSMAKP